MTGWSEKVLAQKSFKVTVLTLITHIKNMFDCVHSCPCRYYGDAQNPCTYKHSVVTKYQKRISGPMLDRIDIHVEVPRVDYEKLSSDRLVRVLNS